MASFDSHRNRNSKDLRPSYPARDFSTGLDHHDPRMRLSFNDDPPEWDRVHEPIPLSMRTGLPEYILKNDDLIFGPPDDRKPGVITYEAKMGLPDGSVNMDNLTDSEMLNLIAEGLEPALPGISKMLPDEVHTVRPKTETKVIGSRLRKESSSPYPEPNHNAHLSSDEKNRGKSSIQLESQAPYYTVHPEPKACEKCRAMAGKKFAKLPMYPHPNCKCEMREHRGGTYRVVEGRAWSGSKGFPEGKMYADADSAMQDAQNERKSILFNLKSLKNTNFQRLSNPDFFRLFDEVKRAMKNHNLSNDEITEFIGTTWPELVTEYHRRITSFTEDAADSINNINNERIFSFPRSPLGPK